MANVRNIASNSLLVFTENIIQKGIDFLVYIWLSSYLSVINYSEYVWVFAYLTICSIFSDLGLEWILTRENSKDRKNAPELMANGLALGLLLTIITILFANGAIFVTQHSPETRKFVLISSLIIIFSPKVRSFRNLFGILFRLDFKIIYVSIFNILGRVIYFFCIFVIMKFEYSLDWVFISFALADLPGFVGLVLYYRKFYGFPRFKIDLAVWKSLIIKSLPLFFSAAFATLHFRVDILLIKMLVAKEQIGFYRNAVLIPEFLTFIPMAFMIPFFPILSKKYSQDRKAFLSTYYTGAKYLLFIIFPLVIFIFFYTENIILLIFKEKFISSISAARIIIFSEIFVYSSGIFNNGLIASNRQNYLLLFSGLSCISNILLNLLLVPKYGIEGAAVATVISYGLFLLWSMFLKKTREFSIIVLKNSLKPLFAAGIMLGFLFVFKLNLWIALVPAAALYLLIFLILKGFDTSDLLFLKELLRGDFSINTLKNGE